MSDLSTYENKELFLRIADGDEQAFTELFHEFAPRLLPFITKLTRNEHVAHEMIQETFLRLWVDRAQLVHIENPSSWIYRMASNLSLTWLRTYGTRKRILQQMPLKDSSDHLSDTLDGKELDGIIQKAILLLPERRQEVYRLSREQGLSHKEIADQLEISPHTVKNLLAQSLKFIQEFINKETGLSLVTIMVLLRL